MMAGVETNDVTIQQAVTANRVKTVAAALLMRVSSAVSVRKAGITNVATMQQEAIESTGKLATQEEAVAHTLDPLAS
jgi:hypothetical protein